MLWYIAGAAATYTALTLLTIIKYRNEPQSENFLFGLYATYMLLAAIWPATLTVITTATVFTAIVHVPIYIHKKLSGGKQ